MLAWWPSQPDLLSALFGLALLASVTLYCRTGKRRWALLAPLLFWLGVCFKETAYVTGVGACLFLARQRRAWPLLGGLALQGVLMFAFRSWVVGAVAVTGSQGMSRAAGHLRGRGIIAWDSLPGIALPLLALGVSLGADLAVRRSWSPGARALLAIALYITLNGVGLGLPWEPEFLRATGTLVGIGAFLLVLSGLLAACRDWPVPELILVWLMAWYFHWSYPAALGWHGYWNSVFGSLVLAIAWVTAVERLVRLAADRLDRADPETVPAAPAAATE
jgi:hypothetical protein